MTSDHGNERGVSRRKVLECMTWAGTGVLWTVAGGVPSSMGIIGEARAAEPSGLTFLQISDSHVGFDKPANPNAIGTLEEALNKINALPVKPSNRMLPSSAPPAAFVPFTPFITLLFSVNPTTPIPRMGKF